MPYYITNSDTSVAITIPDGTIDTASYSLSLVGRNVSNYGQYFAENTIRLLENFASVTAPTPQNLLVGQLWYDKEKQIIRVWDGSNWKPSTGITVENSSPPTDAQGDIITPQPGAAFFNREDTKLYVYDDSLADPWAASYAGEVSSRYSLDTSAGAPDNYGSKLRNIFLASTTGPKAVLALCYNNDSTQGSINIGSTATRFGRETIIAIISDHAPFIVANAPSYTEGETINYYSELFTDPAGIARRNDGKILPGITIRDYSEEGINHDDLASVPRADIAEVANNSLYWGYVVGGPNTPENVFDIVTGNVDAGTWVPLNAEEVLLTTDDLVPNLDIAYTVGTIDNRYAAIYVEDVRTDALTAGSDENGVNPSLPGTITGQWTLGDSSSLNIGPNSDFYVDATATFTVNSSATFNGDVTINGSLIMGAGECITSTCLTSGDTATAGTITGQWTLTAGSTLQATYADLAEKYLPDTQYDPGTVLKLGGDAEVTVTTEVGCTEVFGVVSTDPAYIMNAGLENGIPVAMTGRIPVKVLGPINKGERLISSEIPGVAISLSQTNLPYDSRMVIGRSLEDNAENGVKLIETVVGVK